VSPDAGGVVPAVPASAPGETAAGAVAVGIAVPEVLPAWVPEWLVAVVASVAVLAGSWVLARLLVRLLGRRVARRLDRPSLTRTALRGLRTGVYLFGLLVVLRINGLDLGNIALSVTVFSAVVGVILAPIVGSLISGVFLLADQPYEIGDMIELDDGTRGFVDDITLRYTKMFTLDNTFLVIPNGSIRDRDVINYSAEDTRTRLSLDVLVTYESDIQAARSLVETAARRVEGVISGGPRIRIGAARYPAGPTCYIEAYGDNGVNLRLRYWAQEPYKLLTTRSRVQEEVWTALESTDAAVEIAYPHTHLMFDETSGSLRVDANGAGADGGAGDRGVPDGAGAGDSIPPEAEPGAGADGDAGDSPD